MKGVEVIRNDFVKEDYPEQTPRGAAGLKRGGNTFQRMLIDKKTHGCLNKLVIF